jgi:hypothetical protein
VTENGSTWSNKNKRRREVRGNESLNEKIEDDRSTRKMDRGQLSKRTKTSKNSLEHLTRSKERHVGEALKMQVKLT